MDLSVVVTTLNARERLAACLDALATDASDAEVVVVNGPSTDGTTGMVRDRDDVAVLVEVADRNVNAERNAGLEVATGDAVAFVSDDVVIEPGWRDAVSSALAGGAAIVSGPVRSFRGDEGESESVDRNRGVATGADRVEGGNAAFTRDSIEAIDGFDEYLRVGGSRDAVDRATRLGMRTEWAPDAAVRREPGAVRADGDGDAHWGVSYRSLSYYLAKNHGPRPVVPARTLRSAVEDGASAFRGVLSGTFPPSRWLADGRDVVTNCCRGFADGLVARYRSDEDRNPNGVSSRDDRAVRTYDWR